MKIAIIKKNKISYPPYQYNFARFTRENLEEDIEDYINIKSIKQEELIDVIGEALEIQPDNIVHTTTVTCDENSNYIFEICHLIDEFGTDTTVQNNIAIKLTNNQFRIVGDCIILKHQILHDHTELCDITLNDIIDLYYSSLVKQCVKINPDSTMDDVKYIFGPIDWITESVAHKNYRFHEKEFNSKLIMMYFFEIVPDKKILNIQASRLLGKAIYGTVVIAFRHKPDDIRQTENEYYRIDTNFIEQLIVIMSTKAELLDNNKENKNELKKSNNNTFEETISVPNQNTRTIVDNLYEKIKKKKINDIGFEVTYELSINYESEQKIKNMI